MADQTATQQPATAAPLSHAEAEAALVAVYAALNVAMLAGFAKVIANTPVGATAALMAGLQHVARVSVAGTSARLPQLIAALTTAAHREGIRDAAMAVHRGRSGTGGGDGGKPPGASLDGILGDSWRTHAERSVEVIRAALEDDARVVSLQVLRAPLDVYREVTAAVATAQVGDTGTTPAMARARAFADYSERGVTGFTDRSGRDWSLPAYTEMAVRTASMRAYNIAYQDQMGALGIHLYTVPGDNHPCPLCLPWQGKVLCDGDTVAEHASATVEDARAAGLFHPNCKHVLLPYFPGITKRAEPAEWTAEAAAAYGATQRLRALERRVRGLKQAQHAAIDPAVRADLARRIRATQATIRGHVEQHDLVRRRWREQIAPNEG